MEASRPRERNRAGLRRALPESPSALRPWAKALRPLGVVAAAALGLGAPGLAEAAEPRADDGNARPKAAASEATAGAEAELEPAVQVRAQGELGTLGVVAHTIQYGKQGTLFNYVRDGGQNTLQPFGRLSAEIKINGDHAFVFLYQPLQLRSETVLRAPLTVEGLTFPTGTGLDLHYGFDFYRFSYLYDAAPDGSPLDFEIGLSLQIRNAVVDFTSADGSMNRSYSNIGPVPAIKFRIRRDFENGLWFATEVDGMYAPIRYLNGGNSDVEGAIIDASLRLGYRVAPSVSAFANVRQLAGGAEGTSYDDKDFVDGYTSNWLFFMTGSLGVEWTPSELW